MPSRLKNVFFVHHRRLQRAGVLLPLPLPGRSSPSPEGRLQLPCWPPSRVRHCWWLGLSCSALNCKNKADACSFMPLCSVLQHALGPAETTEPSHSPTGDFCTRGAALSLRSFCCFRSVVRTTFVTPRWFYGVVFWITVMEIINT